MSALEELNGFIHTIRARHSEVGSLTVQTATRWAQEIRELQAEADDSARVAGELAAENVLLKELLGKCQSALDAAAQRSPLKIGSGTIEVIAWLQAERERLQIANAQLQQQLAIVEIGEDPLREM